MGKVGTRSIHVLGYISIFLLAHPSAWALPQFARKYNVSCTMCHAAVPRLNEYGFKFRALGYRTPNEIGQDVSPQEKVALANYVSAQGEFSAFVDNLTDQEANTNTTTEQVNFNRAAVHPFTGSWGKSWGTHAELAVAPSGRVNIEQVYARYLLGDSDTSFGSIRAGIFHAFEGFGAGDQPIGISSPLLLSVAPSRGSIQALYTYFEPSTAGASFNYWLGNTYFNFLVLNRLGPRVTDGNLDGSYLSSQSNQMGDLALSLTHLYDDKGAGSGISLTYYRGQSILPTDSGAFATAGSGLTYRDNFQRLSLFANYFFSTQWELIGGGGFGRDEDFNAGTNLDSVGYFLGAQIFWQETLASGVRFDQFMADTQNSRSTSYSGAIFTNYLPVPEVQLIGEYQFLQTGRSTIVPQNEHILTAKVTVMY